MLSSINKHPGNSELNHQVYEDYFKTAKSTLHNKADNRY